MKIQVTQLNDLDTLTEAQETQRGELIARHLLLRMDCARAGSFPTVSGFKTPIALYHTVKRLLLDGKDS